jgi:hypothetical protein
MTANEVSYDFLDSVWRAHHLPGYGTVSVRDQGFRSIFIPVHPYEDLLDAARGQDQVRDCYFCPHLFFRGVRQRAAALPSIWLHADLDERDPEGLELQPTAWWETSPSRFQALWRLTRRVKPETHAKLNQALNYAVGADRNGWSITKLLRIPGTIWAKREPEYHIEPAVWSDVEYDPKELWKLVKSHSKVAKRERIQATARPVDAKLLKRVPVGVKRKLMAKSADNRSDHCHYLVNTLIEAGFTASETLSLMTVSPVARDKYSGRLEDEVLRILEKIPEPTRNGARVPNPNLFHMEKFSTLMAREPVKPEWLIEGIWSDKAHGIIAGEEKTFKSLIALDLAVSVASGTKFLNYFEVPNKTQGHVIYIQEENQEGFVRDRLEKITISRNLNGKAFFRGSTLMVTPPLSLPMSLMNNGGFEINNPEHMEQLEDHVAEHHTKLVVLDPLYLMMPGIDENSSSDMVKVLGPLLRLKQEYGCGVLILHHYKKQDRQSPMFGETARIAGSSAFGRWYESMLLIERGSEPSKVRLIPKHRMQAPNAGIDVEFEMGEVGDSWYNPIISVPKDEAAQRFETARELVKAQPGITIAGLSKLMGMTAIRTKRMIGDMPDVVVREQPGRQSPQLSIRRSRSR